MMTRKEWAEIKAAAQLLGLGESATLKEIKKAFRRKSKKYHPDVNKTAKQNAESIQMHELSDSYERLLRYCAEYRFPLIPGENEEYEGEDWWFERFGRDHLWGKGGGSEDDPDK
jgi:curved DNA-binding protein CbpA